MRSLLPPLLACLGLVSACSNNVDGPIGVSLIDSGSARPLHADLTGPLRMVTAQGLVRFDRDGQIVPGAAVRWAILEDGRDYIFRIDDTNGLTAQVLARRLRAALKTAPAPLKAVLDTIATVDAVTNTVIEVRLDEPQPDLLLLLARPEFGLDAGGTMRIARRDAGAVLLRAATAEEPHSPPVSVHVERVGRAVARFAAGRVRFVGGGTFADLAVARAATLPRNTLTFDLASGLFGLVPRTHEGPVADAAVRRALSLAIDRDRIVAAIGGPAHAKATTLAGSTIEPPLDERLAEARRLLLGRDRVPTLRIAMPAGPGARLLFALLQQDWGRIGIAAEAVGAEAPADFALLDLVAPPGSLAAIACAASAGCDAHDRMALLDPPYIPIAAPVRWSLVDRKLDGFAENAMAVHPLDQLRRRD